MSALTTSVTPVAATGPRTPEGKAASSRNATTHGLSSGRTVLAHEDEAAYEQILQGYRDELNPDTEHEEYLVQQMADARWRLERAKAIEAAALEIMIFGDACEDSPEHRIAKIMVTKGGDVLNQLQRYAGALERAYYRARREFLQGAKALDDMEAKAAERRRKAIKDDYKSAQTTFLNYINAPLPEPRQDYKTNSTATQASAQRAADSRGANQKRVPEEARQLVAALSSTSPGQND